MDVVSVGIISQYLQISNPETNVSSQLYMNKTRLMDSYLFEEIAILYSIPLPISGLSWWASDNS